jgi:6-phosphogluconolactonase/glucosamine-6-phosphate isomerase/deaminase
MKPIAILPRGTGAAREVALRFLAAGRAAFDRHGRFTAVVSPGVLDDELVRTLLAESRGDPRFWPATTLCLADTWLPDPAVSWNALRALAARLPLAPGAARFDAADQPNALLAANAYEQELRALFALPADGLPSFDLCLLALGANGRVGGLVPGSRALDEVGRLVVADFSATAGRCVLTVTPPVLQRAATLLLACPPAARAAVEDRLHGRTATARFDPLRMLGTAAGEVTIVIGENAAPKFGRTQSSVCRTGVGCQA